MVSFKPSFSHHSEQGIGLVEVMIALLLLAVAALGYTALQARALGSTDEAIVRTQAQTVLRDFAERIRTTGTTDDVLTVYQAKINSPALPNTACELYNTVEQCLEHQVVTDIKALRSQAGEVGVKLGMVTCPNTTAGANTKCLIAAWNQTTPTIGTSNTDCFKSNGIYIFNADCVYMEAY